MCNCISELSKPEGYGHAKGKIITSVDLPTALQLKGNSNQLIAITVTIALIRIEGRQSKQKYTIPNVYCPFCGVRYGQELVKTE